MRSTATVHRPAFAGTSVAVTTGTQFAATLFDLVWKQLITECVAIVAIQLRLIVNRIQQAIEILTELLVDERIG